MRIVISALAILFGVLHIIAAVTQFKSKDPGARWSAAIMVCGGIAVVSATVAHLTGVIVMTLMEAAMGFWLICFAAWLNGKRSGNLHLSHHIIRGTIAALLVAGFVIW